MYVGIHFYVDFMLGNINVFFKNWQMEIEKQGDFVELFLFQLQLLFDRIGAPVNIIFYSA